MVTPADAMPAWTVHRASPMSVEGLQSCTTCHVTLVDYAGAKPTADLPMQLGWPRGTLVAQMRGDAIVTTQVLVVGDDMALCGGSRLMRDFAMPALFFCPRSNDTTGIRRAGR